jgi:murein DD-endopeptidase MepM/ murein hydrolase activator NlpD
MRGADQNVKQFRMSKRSVVAAPAAALLAVSGCIAGLQFRSAYQIDQAEDAMVRQSAAFSKTVEAKEKSIAGLQKEIDRLKKQSSDMKMKLADLQELEEKLKQFTEAYGGMVGTGKSADIPKERYRAESYSPDKKASAMVKLASESELDFRAISGMVDSMEKLMAESLHKEQERRAKLAALPSGWPTVSHTLTSGFGYRTDPFTGRSMFHAGIDIGGKSGDPVFAAADGSVTETGFDSAKGNYIVIAHRGKLKTVYYHLKRIDVKRNDSVLRGEKIGLVGSTGRSTGPHLHFQIMQEDEPVNPFKYLRLVKED